MLREALALTAVAFAAVAFVVLAARPAYVGVRAGRVDENYLKSTDCRTCHADHFDSWARTHHSRMTQEARPQTVQGDFERDNTFEYLGVRARMERRGERFFITFNFPDGRAQEVAVDRTVGSRRIEQYLTKQKGQYTRLPVAYDLVNRRWMSLNGSFFYPDNDNYFQHLTQWDSNCVFCHNVKAQPGINFQTKQFETEVSELGIACGACHGAGAAHAEAALSPFVRTGWHRAPLADKQIVNPRKLTPERALMVCGHCHGQRVPEPAERIRSILTAGDPYNAGEDLSRFYRPVTRETHIGEFSFAARFWANGSPRLTAYEYQGVLRSKCYTAGRGAERLSCLTCHTMHGGDPRGQITAENRTDKPCIACHRQYADKAALGAHTRHAPDSSGSRCYHCHMPRVVYGVMAFHPTHDINVPDPQLTAAEGVPNACNQCHLDKSVNWSIAEAQRLWPARFGRARLSTDAQFDLAEGPRALFAGDALTRALAAEAMGGGGPVKPDPLWATPFLVEAFADKYPVVRFFAAQGLNAPGTPWREAKPDYLATPETRAALLARWRETITPCYAGARADAPQLAARLRARRVDVDLEVGE